MRNKMITAEQMLANLTGRFEGDVLVEKIGPYKFAIRNEEDDDRVDYIFSYISDCFFGENGDLCYRTRQTVERCNYYLMHYPDCKFEIVESQDKIQAVMNEVATRLQVSDSKNAALKDDGMWLATKANKGSKSKSQLQNQDFVFAASLQEEVVASEFLHSFVAGVNEAHSKTRVDDSKFQSSGATVVGLVFDKEKKVADIAILGDAAALAFGRLEDGSNAVVVIANPMVGKNTFFFNKAIDAAKENGYQVKCLDDGRVSFVAEGKKEFFMTSKHRIGWRDEKGARTLAMLGAVGDRDFDGVLIREPHLQSFCEADVASGFEAEFFMVASDGVEKFLEAAKKRYHVFVPNQDGKGYVLANADVEKSDLNKRWLSAEIIFAEISADLAGGDDVSCSVYAKRQDVSKKKIFLLAADGHGSRGGHVARLFCENARSNDLVAMPEGKIDEQFVADEKTLIPYFLENAMDELYSLKTKHFASLDLSDLDDFKEKTAEEFLPQDYKKIAVKILTKRAQVGKKIYETCVNIERQLCRILDVNENCFLKKEDDEEISFFPLPDVAITSRAEGFCIDSSLLDFSRQIEIFEDIKSRFVALLLKKNPTIFKSQKFNGDSEILVSNIVVDGEKIAILKNNRENSHRFVKIDKLNGDEVLEVSFVNSDKLMELSSMFVGGLNCDSVAKIAAKKVASNNLMRVTSL